LQVFTRDPAHKSFTAVVRTTAQLFAALTHAAPAQQLAFIEVELDPMDAQEGLRKGISLYIFLPLHEKCANPSLPLNS
jgi:hypothetical protein